MKISYSMEIKCTPEKVWYWLGTPARAAVWQTNVSETEILKQTSNMIGTTFRETVKENGRQTEMFGVVTGYLENQALAMHLEGKYNSVKVEWRIDAIREQLTRLTMLTDVRFKSFLSVPGVFLRPVFQKNLLAQVHGEFAKLKALCERKS